MVVVECIYYLQALWKTIWKCLKKLNIPYNPDSTLMYLLNRDNENRYPHKKLYANVHSTMTYESER